MTPNAAAAPVPRFGAVTLAPAGPAPAPYSDPRQTVAAPPPTHAPFTSAPSTAAVLPRFGVPPASTMTRPPLSVDATETISVTNVVSAPAINKLGSLFNSLNKTVTGALNTFITQQQTQTSAGAWQPVGQPVNAQFAQQSAVPPAAAVVQVQRFSGAAVPLPQPAALPFNTAAVVAPQRPPGAPRLPSDASSAFVRVAPSVVGGPPPPPRLDAQHRPPGAVHRHPAAPPVRNHVQQPPPPSQLTQSPAPFTDADIYRELPRNHVDPRVQLGPSAGRGLSLHQYSLENDTVMGNAVIPR